MPRPKRYASSARPARSVATRAKKRTSATAQSKQIQTLARQVVSLKKHQALSKTSIMTIGRCDAINLFFQAEDGIRDGISWLEFRRVLFR
eukprot:COSAG06_NODE_44498_length_363_cov_0.575758_1_plen_89_part_10